MFVKVAIYIEARLHTVHALRTALSIVSVSLAAVNAPLEGNFVHCSSTTQQHTGWAAVKILFSSLSSKSLSSRPLLRGSRYQRRPLYSALQYLEAESQRRKKGRRSLWPSVVCRHQSEKEVKLLYFACQMTFSLLGRMKNK